MEPIETGPFTFYPFGIAIALLLVLFFAGTALIMKKRGLKPETASWFAVLAIPICFAISLWKALWKRDMKQKKFF